MTTNGCLAVLQHAGPFEHLRSAGHGFAEQGHPTLEENMTDELNCPGEVWPRAAANHPNKRSLVKA